jgi:hypothetical protein
VSELLDVRVIGAPRATTDAIGRLPELFEVDRQGGPYPSRKVPGLVLYYLTARLRPRWIDQAPRSQIEDRKAARDLDGELEAITSHWAEMEAQPWWPPRVGDVAIGHPDSADADPYGATFLAVRWPRSGEVRFRVISSTQQQDPTPRGGYGIEDLWFEWSAISIVRAGTIYPPTRRGADR